MNTNEDKVFDVGDAVIDLNDDAPDTISSDSDDVPKARRGRPRKTDMAAPKGNIIELDEHDVLITRDAMTKIPKKCYAHELPALYRIHGPDMVEVVATVKVKVADFHPQMEYNRLKAKYDRKNFQCVEAVYGLDGSKIAQMVGVPFEFGVAPHKQNLSINKVHSNPERVRRA